MPSTEGKWGWGLWIGVLWTCASCAGEPTTLADGADDRAPPTIVDEPDFEHVIVGPHEFSHEGSMYAGQWSPDPISDPCDCPDTVCMQTWVEDELGCQLCVTLLCDGEGTHVCTGLCE